MMTFIFFICLVIYVANVECFYNTKLGFTKTLQSIQNNKHINQRLYVSNVPVETSSEAKKDDAFRTPQPKVPSEAWRWPVQWPFPDDFMSLVDDESKIIEYNSNQIERISKHIEYFVGNSNNGKILEIGSDSKCSIPKSISFHEKVGVKLSPNAFNMAIANDEFTNIIEVDPSNDDINGYKLPFEGSSFDHIIFSSGIEYIKEPTIFLKEVLRVLKPGGRCFTAFTSSGLTSINQKPLKMWTTMNDEQKIWIAGAYFHYSGGKSFENIEGYDLYSQSTELLDFKKEESEDGDNHTGYIVQAQKMTLPDFELTFNYTQAILAGSRSMDVEDIKLCSMRAEGAYKQCNSQADKDKLQELLIKLPDIYETVKQIKEVVIPKPVKAMLAMFLLEEWNGSDEQILALKTSTGLETPDEEFWKPVGASTAAMDPKDKINFLSNVVSSFGNPEKSAILKEYPQVLATTIQIIQSKVASIEEGDAQLLATELTISDYLNGSSTSDRFFRFLQQADVNFFTSELAKRKDFWTIKEESKENDTK